MNNLYYREILKILRDQIKNEPPLSIPNSIGQEFP